MHSPIRRTDHSDQSIASGTSTSTRFVCQSRGGANEALTSLKLSRSDVGQRQGRHKHQVGCPQECPLLALRRGAPVAPEKVKLAAKVASSHGIQVTRIIAPLSLLVQMRTQAMLVFAALVGVRIGGVAFHQLWMRGCAPAGFDGEDKVLIPIDVESRSAVVHWLREQTLHGRPSIRLRT